MRASCPFSLGGDLPPRRLRPFGLQLGLGEALGAAADLAVEAELLGAADEAEAEAGDDRAAAGGAGDAVDAELDVAAVEPLAQLVAHLAFLEVALEGAVGPAVAEQGAAVELDRLRSEEHTSELQSRRDLVCRL